MTIRRIRPLLAMLAWLGSGCALWDDTAKLPTGLIATPPSYYSTAKARHLGSKYKENLDRLAERIVDNPNTAELQFANNISSVGGIGFFTHSATKTADDRYLEVVLSTPETFSTKGEYSEKVNRLFSRYGQDLLGILAEDREIYQDKDLAGYGLNLTWRNVTPNASSLERAIIYFEKDNVAKFLRREITPNDLLSQAVIFAVEENGPLNLVSYQPRERKRDFRPEIREDNLTPAVAETKPSERPSSKSASRSAKQAEPRAEVASRQGLPTGEGARARNTAADGESADKSTLKPVPSVVQNAASTPSRTVPAAKPGSEKSPGAKVEAAERLRAPRAPAEVASVKAARESSSAALEVPQQASTAEAAATVASEDEIKASDKRRSDLNPGATKTEILPEQATDKPEPWRGEMAPPAIEAVSEQPKPAVETGEPDPAMGSSRPQTVMAPKPAAEPGSEKIVAAAPRVDKTATEPAPRVAKLETPKPLPEAARKPATQAPEKMTEAPTAPSAKAKTLATDRPQVEAVHAPAPAKSAALRETKSPAAAKSTSDEKQPAIEERVSVSSPAPVETVRTGPAPAAAPLREVNTPLARASSETPAPAIEAPTREEAAMAQSEAMREPSVRVSSEKQSEIAVVSRTGSAAPRVRNLPQIKASDAPPVGSPVESPGSAEVRGVAMAPTSVDKLAQEKTAELPAVRTAEKLPEIVTTRTIERPAIEPAKLPKDKAVEAPAARAAIEKLPEKQAAEKIETTVPAVGAMRTADLPSTITAVPTPTPAVVTEQAPEKAPTEQLALLRKPPEASDKEKPFAKPAPKALEGFIIQIAFSDKEKAQSWAQKMQQRGYAVSVTETGARGPLRVRLGNFADLEEAERRLRAFKQEGMSGIVINLPQAFQPVARSSMP